MKVKKRDQQSVIKDIVVIGLTASKDNVLRQACIQAGMHVVLAKSATFSKR